MGVAEGCGFGGGLPIRNNILPCPETICAPVAPALLDHAPCNPAAVILGLASFSLLAIDPESELTLLVSDGG